MTTACNRVVETLARRYARVREETDKQWEAVKENRREDKWDEGLVHCYALGLRRCWKLRTALAGLLGEKVEGGAA